MYKGKPEMKVEREEDGGRGKHGKKDEAQLQEESEVKGPKRAFLSLVSEHPKCSLIHSG